MQEKKLKRVGLPPSKRSFNVISLTHRYVILDQSWFSPSKPSYPTPLLVSIHPGPAIRSPISTETKTTPKKAPMQATKSNLTSIASLIGANSKESC